MTERRYIVRYIDQDSNEEKAVVRAFKKSNLVQVLNSCTGLNARVILSIEPKARK